MQIHSSYFWLKSGLNENAIQSFEEELASLTASETVESGDIHLQFVADHADKWDRVQVYDIQT
jgi:hypothetical protein